VLLFVNVCCVVGIALLSTGMKKKKRKLGQPKKFDEAVTGSFLCFSFGVINFCQQFYVLFFFSWIAI
jgi:hypothetical protein